MPTSAQLLFLVVFVSLCAFKFLEGTSSMKCLLNNAPSTGIKDTNNLANLTSADYQAMCKEKLDDLDRIWDTRRDARLDMIKDVTSVQDGRLIFDLFEPEAVCFDDERFGSLLMKRYFSTGDGGKFVCGVDTVIKKANTTKDCLVYNVGSNNQIEFEQEVSNTFGKGCEIHTFDPTVTPKDYYGHNYSVFHDWGLGADGNKVKSDNYSYKEMSVLSIMQKLGHKGRTIDIFKIDCEGCEYTAMTEAFEAIAKGRIKIDQVQVELHGHKLENFPNIKKLILAADKANMRIFHKERNHWGCNGYECVEYAFASKEFLRKANANHVCGWLGSSVGSVDNLR